MSLGNKEYNVSSSKTSKMLRIYLKMFLGKLMMTLKGYVCDTWMLHFKEKNT